jgi:hypothetical protein
MPPIIYLTPVSALPTSVAQLSFHCKQQLLSMLYVRIVEEDLIPRADGKTFVSKHGNWMEYPRPRVIKISTLGVETLLQETTDYTVSYTGGVVTLLSATTDIIRVDYNYFPFTDPQLANFTLAALHEISVLIYRTINENNIPCDYAVTICKRLYTIVLKALLLEARDYFSVSVGGRTISKTNIAAQIESMVTLNEQMVKEEVDILRVFNKTNRVLPKFTQSNILDSNAEIN